MARIPGTFDFSANLEVNKLGPLDARLTVESKSELTGLPFAYIGMVVSVTSDTTPANNGVYVLNDTNSTDVNNWTLLTEGASLPTGGTTGQVLSKTDATDYNVEWTDAIEGAKGEPGNDGATGPQGLTGATGPQGLTGNDGAKGEPGNDGAAGSDGAKGEPGNDGATGPTGPIGATGPQGLTGNDGAKGEPGNDGAKGEPGNDGATGPTGPQGLTGNDGAKGEPGNDGAAGNDGAKGEPGNDGAKGETGAGVPIGGTTGQSLVKTSNTDYDAEWTTITSGGATKYLLRLEYDVNEALINNSGSFVSSGGFSAGANISSYTIGSGASGHFVSLSFANESNPPLAIFAYGWQPVDGSYKVIHFDNDDTSQIKYNTSIADFAEQSTNEGGSGNTAQWAASTNLLFTGDFGNYTITVPVEQSILKYGDAISGGFGSPSKYPHVYILFIF